MTLPVKDVVLPAVLIGQSNGRLPASILRTVPDPTGGADVRLVEPAARSFVAWRAYLATRGIRLKATSSGDSYRTYDQQVTLFKARYVTYDTGRESKTWLGVRYWLRPNMASAAVPGTSNHGLAITVDAAEELDGDAGPESLRQSTVDIMEESAARYGWSWELQDEPWHVRYVDGDNIPAAVREFEDGETTMMVIRNTGTGAVYGKDGAILWPIADQDAVKDALALANQTGYKDVAPNRIDGYGVNIVALVDRLVTAIKGMPAGGLTVDQVRQALDGAVVASKLDTTP